MASNYLHLNTNRTECVVFGPSSASKEIISRLASMKISVSDHVKNLGVIMESSLVLDKQVSSVVRAAFYQLRIISKLKSILSFRDLETIIHAFVSSRIDYCNSVYIGITQGQLSRLQLVQNAAARFLTRTKKRERITPVLVSLHWLPLEFRIEFKILLMVYKALHGFYTKCIAELLIPYQNSRNLRSSNQMILHVPKTRLKSKGDRAFSVAAPRLWNPLPIKSSPSVDAFKSR